MNRFQLAAINFQVPKCRRIFLNAGESRTRTKTLPKEFWELPFAIRCIFGLRASPG